MINKNLLTKRFNKNLSSYNQKAEIQKNICANLSDIAEQYCNYPVISVFEIGCGTGFLTNNILKVLQPYIYYINDITEGCIDYIKPLMQEQEHLLWHFFHADAEKQSIDIQIDILVSASTFQWFDDFPAFILKAKEWLTTNGLFIFSTYGSIHFNEIKSLTGVGLNYFNKDELYEILQAHFTILHYSEDIFEIEFEKPIDVLKHIKATGVNSIETLTWTKKTLKDFETNYVQSYSLKKECGVTLTYNPLYIVAQRND